MGIGQILGIGKREGVENKKIKEIPILSLEYTIGLFKPSVVAERTQLMGSEVKDNNHSSIVTFEPGDEIIVIEEYRDKTLDEVEEFSRGFPPRGKRICIILHNALYTVVPKYYYFSLKQLEGRKIKIDQNAAIKYSKLS